jgi:hypothetical protein
MASLGDVVVVVRKMQTRLSALGQKQTYAAKTHVRFTPNSDRKSEFPQTVMSALLPKATCAVH